MSIDRSLKSANSLTRHRNVLSRAERIQKLQEEELWQPGKDSTFGLPKVAHRKVSVGKKVKKKLEGEDAAATPAS